MLLYYGWFYVLTSETTKETDLCVVCQKVKKV